VDGPFGYAAGQDATAPDCITHTEVPAGGDIGAQTPPVAQLPMVVIAHAAALLVQVAGGLVAAPPLGPHDPPVITGAASVTDCVPIGVGLHDAATGVDPCAGLGTVHDELTKNDITGFAHVTLVGEPHEQLAHVAAGAWSPPCPVNTGLAHGGAPVPVKSATGPLHPEGDAGQHVPVHATIGASIAFAPSSLADRSAAASGIVDASSPEAPASPSPPEKPLQSRSAEQPALPATQAAMGIARRRRVRITGSPPTPPRRRPRPARRGRASPTRADRPRHA
jgi:hypothetical protein